MDPSYGSVPMLSDADKMRTMASDTNIKEERNKDSSSPNDLPKPGQVN